MHCPVGLGYSISEGYFMGLRSMLGLSLSEEDRALKALVDSSYSSVRVVGRGTVRIDPREVRQSEEFKAAQAKARAIVKP